MNNPLEIYFQIVNIDKYCSGSPKIRVRTPDVNGMIDESSVMNGMIYG